MEWVFFTLTTQTSLSPSIPLSLYPLPFPSSLSPSLLSGTQSLSEAHAGLELAMQSRLASTSWGSS